MNECMLQKSKTTLNISTHVATCHHTWTHVLYMHKHIILQQTSTLDQITKLDPTASSEENKWVELSATLRYKACSESQDITPETIQRPDLHSPRLSPIRHKQSSVPLHNHQIIIKPDMSINLSTKYKKTCLEFLQPMIMRHRKNGSSFS